MLFPIFESGKWGFIDRLGAIKVQPRYEHAGQFCEGFSVVHLKNRAGYLSLSGDISIPARFDLPGMPFSSGLAVAAVEGNFGFLNCKGHWQIKPCFSRANPFSEELAAVKDPVSQKWGYIDQNGDWEISPRFFCAAEFSDGLAGIMDENGEVYFISKDQTINLRISDRFRTADSFSNGLSLVRDRSSLPGQCGYIDCEGTLRIQPRWRQAKPFREDVACVCDDNTGKWYYINRSGEEISERIFDEASTFSEGVAAVKTERGWGLINKEFDFVLKPCKKFIAIQSFYSGLSSVILSDGYSGYIDKSGTTVWKSKGLRKTRDMP